MNPYVPQVKASPEGPEHKKNCYWIAVDKTFEYM